MLDLYNSFNRWTKKCFVCLFVCLFGVFRPTREFFIHLETSPLPAKGCKFWPISALMIIEQWGFFSVPHLLWPFKMVISKDPWHSYWASGSKAVTTCFKDLGLSRLGRNCCKYNKKTMQNTWFLPNGFIFTRILHESFEYIFLHVVKYCVYLWNTFKFCTKIQIISLDYFSILLKNFGVGRKTTRQKQ